MSKPSENSYVRLAVASYEHFVLAGHMLPRPSGLPEEMTARRAGVFVSLHLNAMLRGCIGTITPQQPCIADEIIHNAVSAAAHDPRFEPLRKDELAGIECSVDVLLEPEEVKDLSELNVIKYGVIVSSGGRRGLPAQSGRGRYGGRAACHRAGKGRHQAMGTRRYPAL